jgi:CRISPR locus-related DNA-binding protein
MSTGKTTQIVLVGWDYERVLAGIRSFPLDKLILLPTPQEEREIRIRGSGKTSLDYAKRLEQTISEVMRVEIELHPIPAHDFEEAFKTIVSVVKQEQSEGSEVILNVSSGTKIMSAAAICAAFIHGIKTCYTIPETEIYEAQGAKDTITLPMLVGFKPLQTLSESAVLVLNTLKRIGGRTETMKVLANRLGWSRDELGKLSYHLSKLEAYGLIRTKRVGRELTIQLSETGFILASEPTPNKM